MVKLQRYITLALAMLLTAASHCATERKPNFIFVIADDHSWDALGVVQREHGEKGRYPWFGDPVNGR